MPHAVIEGELTPERVHRELAPFQVREGDMVLRVGECFLGRTGDKALLEAIAVEGPARTSRKFLVEISRREDGVTVHLFPLTDPEKTDGVRCLTALVAERVRALDPDARIVRSNLESFLEESSA